MNRRTRAALERMSAQRFDGASRPVTRPGTGHVGSRRGRRRGRDARVDPRVVTPPLGGALRRGGRRRRPQRRRPQRTRRCRICSGPRSRLRRRTVPAGLPRRVDLLPDPGPVVVVVLRPVLVGVLRLLRVHRHRSGTTERRCPRLRRPDPLRDRVHPDTPGSPADRVPDCRIPVGRVTTCGWAPLRRADRRTDGCPRRDGNAHRVQRALTGWADRRDPSAEVGVTVTPPTAAYRCLARPVRRHAAGHRVAPQCRPVLAYRRRRPR